MGGKDLDVLRNPKEDQLEEERVDKGKDASREWESH